MSSIIGAFFVLTLILAMGPAKSYCDSAATKKRKKVIEFGWDAPDTEYLRKNIAQMEEQPFDGCVFYIKYTQPNGAASIGKEGAFLHEAWGTRAFTRDELKSAMRDLQLTPFTKFTDNFIRLNVAPGNVDWFDDFSAIVNNIALLGEVAFKGGAKGIFFDTEYYHFPLFEYEKQKYKERHSFIEYSQQAKKRGLEIMEALQSAYPDITIIFSYAYTLPAKRSSYNAEKLKQNDYALLIPFLDGMLEGAKGKTKLIDGYEFSYKFKYKKEFVRAREETKSEILSFIENKRKYQDHFFTGFGLWLDTPSGSLPWAPTNLLRNYFSPAEFRRSVSLALEHSDEYVWIYNQKARWWRHTEETYRMPTDYALAIRAAKNEEQQ
jgi:hypothetical protein